MSFKAIQNFLFFKFDDQKHMGMCQGAKMGRGSTLAFICQTQQDCQRFQFWYCRVALYPFLEWFDSPHRLWETMPSGVRLFGPCLTCLSLFCFFLFLHMTHVVSIPPCMERSFINCQAIIYVRPSTFGFLKHSLVCKACLKMERRWK